MVDLGFKIFAFEKIFSWIFMLVCVGAFAAFLIIRFMLRLIVSWIERHNKKKIDKEWKEKGVDD